jgi:hypothetical protein
MYGVYMFDDMVSFDFVQFVILLSYYPTILLSYYSDIYNKANSHRPHIYIRSEKVKYTNDLTYVCTSCHKCKKNKEVHVSINPIERYPIFITQ